MPSRVLLNMITLLSENGIIRCSHPVDVRMDLEPQFATFSFLSADEMSSKKSNVQHVYVRACSRMDLSAPM